MKNPYFNLVQSVWQYGAPWRWAIVGYYIASCIAQGLLSLSPYAFGRAIDVLQEFTPDKLDQVIFWLVAGVALMLLFWVFHGPARIIERRVALKIKQSFLSKIYQDITHLPLKWHQDHHSGNVLTRVNRSATSLYRFAGDQFIYNQSIVKFFVSIGFLTWISVPVGLISFLSSALIIAMILLFDKKLIPLYEATNEVDNHVGAVLFDYINNMTTILTLRLGQLTHSNLLSRMKAIWPFYNPEIRLNEAKWFCVNLALNAIQAIILIGYILNTLHANQAIMIGLVVMIFRYQLDLTNVFFELSMQYGEIVKMDADVRSIKPIQDDIARLAHLPKGAATARQWHTIDIAHLAFHHAPGENRGQIFDDIHFKIQRGEKIALIGASGGGKSTLLNLLCGLYTPSSVNLKIDQIEFNTLEPLQAITTLIPQDPELFENTIRFNITMDLPTDEREIQRVVELSGFSNVLATLPEGLDTDIREKGLNLSVGQKQRLALARGLFAARFSSLILMDEPTSSVDLATEKVILSGVIDTFPASALMVSLHRLHLLPQFDSVIMLSQGKVVAAGRVSDLLNTPGPVQDLWLGYQAEST